MKGSTKKMIEEIGTYVVRVAAGSAAAGATLCAILPALKGMKLPAKVFYYLGSWGVGIGVSNLLEHSINKEIHETLEMISPNSEDNEEIDGPNLKVVPNPEESPE